MLYRKSEQDNRDHINLSTTRTGPIDGDSCCTEKESTIIVITSTDQRQGQPLSRMNRVVQKVSKIIVITSTDQRQGQPLSREIVLYIESE